MPFQDLVSLIVTQNSSQFSLCKMNKEQLIEYISTDAEGDKVEEKLKEITITIQSFHFTKPNDEKYYSFMLNRFKSVTFEKCTFDITYLRLEDTETYYKLECVFQKEWYIDGLHNEKDNTIFHQCTFKGYVYSLTHEINKKIFCNCTFEADLEFGGIVFNASIFEGKTTFKESHLKLLDCTFNEKFILNKVSLEYFNANNCLFKNKFEFKGNNVKEFILDDTNFEKLVDTFQTKYGKFKIVKCIFDDFVGFEGCEFKGSDPALFKYATFLSFINFRETQFCNGFDIKNINLKESPNFLGISISSENERTPRETFRIIKHSFEKTGNNIEANKFFVEEMKRYKTELNNNSDSKWSDKVILCFNEKISGFGQSYLKPISWICITALAFMGISYSHTHNWLYQFSPETNAIINSVTNTFNIFATSILPFSKLFNGSTEGIEFLSLVFYIVFASLIWQTVVAIKRHTKK